MPGGEARHVGMLGGRRWLRASPRTFVLFLTGRLRGFVGLICCQLLLLPVSLPRLRRLPSAEALQGGREGFETRLQPPQCSPAHPAQRGRRCPISANVLSAKPWDGCSAAPKPPLQCTPSCLFLSALKEPG